MIALSWLVHCLLILLSVAFFTLFERKVIGLFHIRLGPNKVSFIGLVQPLLDAFKLLSKQNITPLRTNKLAYNFSPIFGLFLSLFVWLTMPSIYMFMSLNYSLVMFFCVGSVIVFAVLLAGWSSNSKYSLIGSLRSVAQSISYESVFSTLLVLIVLLLMSFSIRSSYNFSSIVYLYILPLWVICTLAETHRAPFDFSEAESELVSGFNTEYSGAYFAFIFLSEYAVLLYSSILISLLFFSWLIPINVIRVVLTTLVVSFVFIWIRITFCRFRYDILIMAAWKVLLPISLVLFISYVPLLFSQTASVVLYIPCLLDILMSTILLIVTSLMFVYSNTLFYTIALLFIIVTILFSLVINSIIQTLTILIFLIVYVGAMIILIGYICAISPNLIINISSSGLYTLLIFISFSFFFFRKSWLPSRLAFDPVNNFFYSSSGLYLFILIVLMLFITLLIVTTQYLAPKGPFRSIRL